MKIIQSITAFNSSEKTIVTIGTFDGIHVGHQKILKDLIRTAKKRRKEISPTNFFPPSKDGVTKRKQNSAIKHHKRKIWLTRKNGA